MSVLWRTYTRLLASHPFKTQAVMSGVLMGSGDMIAQFAVERKKLSQWDMFRTSRFAAFGLFIAGPIVPRWYKLMDRLMKGSPKVKAVKMVAADQALFAPFFLGNFLWIMSAARGDSAEHIKDIYRNDYVPILITNYKVWPACQIINFTFIPLQHRLLYVNLVALAWNTYLAWRTEHGKVSTATPDVSAATATPEVTSETVSTACVTS